MLVNVQQRENPEDIFGLVGDDLTNVRPTSLYDFKGTQTLTRESRLRIHDWMVPSSGVETTISPPVNQSTSKLCLLSALTRSYELFTARGVIYL